MQTLASERSTPRAATRWVTTLALLVAAVLIVVGLAISLTPALVFHSGPASRYGGYPIAGLIVALTSLVPANVGAVLALRPRMRTPLLVVLLVAATAVVAAFLCLAFIFIYLSTIDWMVF